MILKYNLGPLRPSVKQKNGLTITFFEHTICSTNQSGNIQHDVCTKMGIFTIADDGLISRQG
jgi:hypothetical protein